MSEKELDMNDLINSFDECSTDYTKTACVYYGDYLRNYQKEKLALQQERNNYKELYEKEKGKYLKAVDNVYQVEHKLQQKINAMNELKEWLKEYIENTKIQYQGSHPTRQYSLEVIKDTLQATLKKVEEIERL